MIRFLLLLVAACYLSTSLADESSDEFVLLSSYHVSTKVNSRLLTTTIDMIFENTMECSVLHGISLQIPKDAIVTDLVMDLSDGCQLESEVKTLENAVEDFQDYYEEGKPAAILTAWDMSNFELQVSIPPSGTTAVSLKYQEVLVQKLDKVSFQVPMFPGVDVDDLKVDVSVEEPNGGLVDVDFRIDSKFDNDIETVLDIASAGMHFERRSVTEALALPTLIQAHFQPGPPPENGLLMTDADGECFTHVFNPTEFLSDAGPMARKIVFVIDVSGSMQGQKLRDAQASFSVMIDTLEKQDVLLLQTFASYGTEDLWGPNAATPENKARAIEFVNALETKGSTNLHDAFKDAIYRVGDAQETAVPIVVAMTDGRGNMSPNLLASIVRSANKDGRVKVFSIAFGEGADMNLLLVLALQNGGRAVRIYEGFGDSTNQMEQFYKQELGKILMSDISVSYDSEVGVLDSTLSTFSVLAAGSEIVVRGRMESSAAPNNSTRSLKSLVSATSAIGLQEWAIDNIVIPENSAGNCRQSYAQARIMELLEYRDANRTLGGELFATAVSRGAFEVGADESFQEQARQIALDAQLVWPGLTALITVENANCQINNSDVCFSGSDGGFDADRGRGYSGAKSNPGTRRGWSICFETSSLILIVLSSMTLVV
jgi:uncharacterized protein YegL